ncbi:MAG: FISUMP domain-containing protein, partial [Bacteroidota bacterium]
AITGATSYLWTLPAGASVASGNNTNSIIVDFSLLAVSGNVTVLGQSTLCGSGQPSSVALNVHPIPQPAGPITGPATICTPASAGVYSTLPMTGADSYSWTLPAGAAIISGGTTNTISVNFNIAAIPGTISVVGTNNTCGSGQPATLALNIAPSPQAAGPITGLTNICTPASGIAYSVPAITGANSYLWTVPAGASVISGGNTNSITADFDNSAATGPITVSAQSTLCGNGQPSALVLNIHPLPQPAGAITGITTICTPLTSVNYSISAVTGANSYIWTLPSGVTVTGGNNTSAITVDFSQAAASGTISVKAHSNFCGDGTPSSMALTIHPSPEPAGQITGASPVCQGNAIITYSISPLAYTTSYDWSVPPGVSVVGGAGTNMISCLVTTSAVSGNFSVRGHNAECSFGQPALKSVIINPLPGAAGSITSPSGAIVCQGSTGNPYTVVPIQDATSYFWEYSGTGYTFTNNGSNLLIDFSSSATPGNLKVTGSNSCGDGTVSPLFPVTVNPKPVTDFVVCNDLKTTKNGRPILLKGGYPLGTGGAYSGTGVTQVSPGNYVFDPSNSSVSAGGTVNPVNYTITFRYTNIYNCSDEKSKVVAVFASNGNDPCPGTVKDYRDDKSYPTFLTGAGINTRCWTASNLNYGNYTDQALTQTDNCIFEKYCRNNLATQCDLYGGYYQWGELMHYQETPVFQDICPPGWHVATSAEWDNLITTNLGNGIAGSALKDTMNVNSFKGLLKGVLYLNHSWAFGSGTNSGSIYWTSDAGSPETAASRGLNSFNLSVSLYQSSRANAFPVRCVRN